VATTTKLLLPYPTLSDSDNVPRDMKALAEAVEAVLYQPYCELVASAATTGILANTATKVNLATTVHNDTDFFSVSGSVITVLQAGKYNISARSKVAISNRVDVVISKNGLYTAGGSVVLAASSGGGNGLWAGTPYTEGEPLAANDTVELDLYLAGAGATDHSSSTISRLYIRKIG